MKFAAALIALSTLSSTSAFVPDISVQRGSQLWAGPQNKYAVSKWSPQGNAGVPSAGATATVASPVAAPAAGPSMADLAKAWAGMNSDSVKPAAGSMAAAPVVALPAPVVESSGGAPQKNYSVTKWSPRTGSNPVWGSAAVAEAAVDVAADPSPVAASAPPTVADTSAKKNYSVTKWSPLTGSNPGFGAGASSSSAAPSSVTAEPAPVAAAAGPSMADLAKEWASMNTAAAKPAAGAMAPAPVAPSATASAPSASYGGSSAAAAPKKNYSVTKWSPRTGATGGFGSTGSAPGGWAPAVASSEAVAADPVPAPVAAAPVAAATPAGPSMADLAKAWSGMNTESKPITTSAGTINRADAIKSAPAPKKDYSMTKWSPQDGATGGSGWAVPAGSAVPEMVTAAAAPQPVAAAPSGPSMADLASQWAGMNTSR